jgi:chromosome segregation protein
MKISRLRLLGFKSFVEPTELIIERGLTGVVGPNGCGKSNLLEALRWVMGETSHKSMRAAAMDDVIFSGTTARPARNAAEVTIFIDNSERLAPAEFNDRDTIEITRRIEREAGSAYRINGKEARARDVKILFEDAATGARSPALVRQGQIGEIVNAKPEQRRRILEDAAGIAGLHSRRHEADLRLKAAEANLARLTDVLGQLNSQIEGLKRQARQARRYKDISSEIRRADALLHHLAWAEAQAQVEAEEHALRAALAELAGTSEAEAKAMREEAEHAELLAPLREAEAEKAAVLGRLRVECEALEREATRAAEHERDLRARAEHLVKDLARERDLLAEAGEAHQRHDGELGALEATEADADEAEAAARARLQSAEAESRSADQRLTEATNRAADMRARRHALETGVAERRNEAARIVRQIAALEAQARDIAARAPDSAKLAATTVAGQELARALADIEARGMAAEDRAREAAAAAKAAREESARAKLAARVLTTERETLQKLLLPVRDADHPPVLDHIRVAAGYEVALGAALGDDLEAPLAADAPVHWCHVEGVHSDWPLPQGVEPLTLWVDAPPELSRRLRQTGVVPRELGAELQADLLSGQRLVSPEGDLWRWDGFVAAAHGETPAAQRLRERNRLVEVERSEAEARADAEALAAAEAEAAAALVAAERQERQLRQTWRETQARLAATRESLTQIERAARETESRLAAVAEAKARAGEDLVAAHERVAEIEAALDLLAEGDDPEPAASHAQSEAVRLRALAADARAVLAGLERERTLRRERLQVARAERERWAARRNGAERQLSALQKRLDETQAALAALAELPPLIEAKRGKLRDAVAAAEQARKAAADQLAAAETAQRAAGQALRAAQAAVATARETRARIEAKLESARARRQEEARRIREGLGVAPSECLAIAEIKEGTPLPPLADVDRQLARLKADRERLGGVNLQAEEELGLLAEQHGNLERERNDVEQAIAKLRGAIGQLNREAKKRLQEAFDTVNGHFQRLFTTLFMGGEARLEMVESEEDPLEGGLEIFARPPGKKPATLSLLSGGEQTLTALSLIFAVFLTNPSPICVLDEVDAPLDDANVDRFCTLMEKMAGETATRFLVITHHPMTMTRVNRLFGVTMAEKGISQLVSVDLETAQRFQEAV